MINTISTTIDLEKVCLKDTNLGNGVIYRGDDLATALEIKAPLNVNAYVLLACITPNGRTLGPFVANDTESDTETSTYSFVLTKANGYNFAVGRTELIVYYCVVNTNSSITKKAIGSICVDVHKGVSLDDEATFIIGDTTDADAVLTDLNTKMDNLINQVASYSTQLSNKLDAVNNRVTLTNSGRLFTSRVESGTDYSVKNQGATGISNKIDSSTAENIDARTATTTTITIATKNTNNSTEQKQTANYVTLKATDGTNTKTFDITPTNVKIDNHEVITDETMVTVDDVATKISVSMDPTTYVVTISLLNENNEVLDTASLDLPSESTVVSGYFDDTTNILYLTLRSGSTIAIPLSNLISGLASTTYVDTQDALKLDKSITSSGNTTTYLNSGTGSEIKTVETGTILDGEYTEQTKRTTTNTSILEEYRYEDEGEDFNTTEVASVEIHKNSSNAPEVATTLSSSDESDNTKDYIETITSGKKTERYDKNSTYTYQEETTANGKTITATNTDSGDETVIVLSPTGVTINGETLIDTGNIGTYAPQTKYYNHNVFLKVTASGSITRGTLSLQITDKNSSDLTFAEVCSYLSSNGYTTQYYVGCACSGYFVDSAIAYAIVGCYVNTSTNRIIPLDYKAIEQSYCTTIERQTTVEA